MKYLGLCKNNFQTKHAQVQYRETEAAYAKCMAELNFQFTTDMLWKHERAIFSLVID